MDLGPDLSPAVDDVGPSSFLTDFSGYDTDLFGLVGAGSQRDVTFKYLP